jgi:hypothetical protein
MEYLFFKVIISLFATIIGHCVPCRATVGTRSPPVVVGQAGLGGTVEELACPSATTPNWGPGTAGGEDRGLNQ